MPRTYPFMQVDAFTTEPLSGNACAVVFDADDLDTATMQAIAREQNLSETSFVLRPTDPALADFRARYFTPGEEIPLAGHPTIATGFALVDSGRLKLNPDRHATTIALELNVGPIRVDITHSATGRSGVAEVAMYQKTPVFGAVYPAETTAAVFGLSPDDLLPGVPIQTVSTGTAQLMLIVRDHDRVTPGHARSRRLRPVAPSVGQRVFQRTRFLPRRCHAEGRRVRAAFHGAARLVRRPVYRLGHRRHGRVPVALRPAENVRVSSPSRATG